jgi:hypothetical protein
MKSIMDSDSSVKHGIEKRGLDIIQDTNATSSDFNVYLYGQDGSLHYTDTKFDDDTFNKLFTITDDMTPKQTSSQSGGSKNVNYREKYFKYKNKYEDMKNVITSFTSYTPQH